ncbi:hypothetical protein PENTCL1PPCAC_25020, partial [Pristionchus entomophagus]
MAILTPDCSCSCRIVSPALPITSPHFVPGMSMSYVIAFGPSLMLMPEAPLSLPPPPPPARRAFARVITSKMSCFARSTAIFVPCSVHCRVPSPLLSGAIWTRAPDCAWICVISEPPFPITRPTLLSGTMITSTTFSCGLPPPIDMPPPLLPPYPAMAMPPIPPSVDMIDAPLSMLARFAG